MCLFFFVFPQKPAILDPTSDGDKILDYLEELLLKLNDLQDKAFQYKSYQKAFKVGLDSLGNTTTLKICIGGSFPF